MHFFETMGNYCLLVFTGESSRQGFLGGEDFVHPQSKILPLGSTHVTIQSSGKTS